MLKLLTFAFIVAAGQLLFKRVARDVSELTGIGAILRHIMVDPWFITATALYVCATILWILALRDMPLSRAYPFMALAFVLVPVGAFVFYGETLGIRYFVGLGLVLAGIAVIGDSSIAEPRGQKDAEAIHA